MILHRRGPLLQKCGMSPDALSITRKKKQGPVVCRNSKPLQMARQTGSPEQLPESCSQALPKQVCPCCGCLVAPASPERLGLVRSAATIASSTCFAKLGGSAAGGCLEAAGSGLGLINSPATRRRA
jgi:hypothetical protein